MSNDIFETWVSKYLDGEITPSEQLLLDETLTRDAGAGELFDELCALHDRSQQAFDSGVLEQGRSARGVIESALTHHAARTEGCTIKKVARRRFAVGLAAGLVVGLVLNYVLTGYLARPKTDLAADGLVPNSRASSGNVLVVGPSRNVDWYSFSDSNGTQWLIEGYRENIVQPAKWECGL